MHEGNWGEVLRLPVLIFELNSMMSCSDVLLLIEEKENKAAKRSRGALGKRINVFFIEVYF